MDTDTTPTPDATPAIVAEMRELAARLVDGAEKIPAEFRHEFAEMVAAARKHL